MSKEKNLKSEFLSVATKLFIKYGYHKTSMDEIAKSSHRAKRSLYNHFSSKEELFESVMKQELQTARNTLQGIFDHTDLLPSVKFTTYMVKRMELLSQSLSYKVFLQNEFNNDISTRFVALKAACADFDRWEKQNFLAIAKDISVVMDQQSGFDPRAFADMVQMIVKSLDVSFFVQNRYDEYHQTYQYMVNLIVESLVYRLTTNLK